MKNKILKLLHDYLYWCFPVKFIGGDAFQPIYSCKFCDGELACDSNGDAFHFRDPKADKGGEKKEE